MLRFDYEPESDILVATCEGDLTVDLLKDSITVQAEQGHWQSALIFDATAAKPATLKTGPDISSILAHSETPSRRDAHRAGQSSSSPTTM